jgi:hypothetical protein
MDDRKLSTPPDHRDQVERLPSDPVGESGQVVYCGNAQQVREGYAIALRAMGVAADFLPGNIASSTISPTREYH